MSTEIEKRAEEIGKEMAYPIMGEEVPNTRMSFGLTKLELFAAMAMQGLLAQMPKRTDVSIIANESVICAKALCVALAEAEMKEVENGK